MSFKFKSPRPQEGDVVEYTAVETEVELEEGLSSSSDFEPATDLASRPQKLAGFSILDFIGDLILVILPIAFLGKKLVVCPKSSNV